MNAHATLALAGLLAGGIPPAAADLLTESVGAEVTLRADIEGRVRDVMVHRVAADQDGLAADVAALDARDAARRDAGQPPSGLTDNVRYLAAAVPLTRDARRAALEDVLDEHPDPLVRRLTEFRLERADDAAAADDLLRNDRHNRRASVLNDAVRPFGLSSGLTALGALNPFLLAGSAVDSVATTAVNLWHYNRLSTPEREALARYRTLLTREPDTTDAPEIARAIRRLGEKRAEAACDDTRTRAERALDDGDLDRATFFLDIAGTYRDCDVAKLRETLTDATARRTRSEEAGRWPADDTLRPASDGERHDYEDLARATVLGEPGPMMDAGRAFAERHDASPLAPSARYVVAVGEHLADHPDDGREDLAGVAEEDDRSVGRHAAAVLASDDYDRLRALHTAERQHRRDTVRYVFFGRPPDGRSALYTASRLGAGGLQAAQSLGVVNVIGILTRAWQVWRHDPVSNQAIIDRGEELLAHEPPAAEASEAHARLAQAYERAGEYGRALMHYRATSDPDPEEITRLEGRLADDILDKAGRAHDDPQLLALLVERFASTDAAEKARAKLHDLPPAGDTVVSREMLVSHPALLGPDALDLDAVLLDGDRKNGELADAGVAFTDGSLRLTLHDQDDDGEHVETRPLSADAYARARAAAQEALYTTLLATEQRDPDTGRFERYIPVYLQGSVDEGGGVYVSPALKLRRYRSEDAVLYE